MPSRNTQGKLRLGVVGLGLRSSLGRHVAERGLPAAVTAICDPIASRRESGGTLYPDADQYADHRELLALDLDGVVLTTPDHTHEELAIDFLEAGVAVFVDKPLAITTAGCDRVLAAAARTGTKLYVGHNMRHMPVVQVMRELIQDGQIGAVKAIWCRHFVGHGGDFYFKDWHADRRRTTGLLLQKGAHDLDVIHWLADGYTTRVNAMGGLTVYGDITARGGQGDKTLSDWYDPDRNWPPTSLTGLNDVVDVEDISMMNMYLDNGVFATYQQCHYTPDYWRNYTVIGTRGRLENFGDTDGAVVKVWNGRRSGYRVDADLVVEVPSGAGGHGGADPELLAEFVSFVRAGVPTLTSSVAARQAVAAGYAATESLRGGGVPVDVPALPRPPAHLVDPREAR
ncbi:Gfo/Idh/MocA family oxidoreductase [Streptomyces sp. 4503]|uniref:Gfo/Idh/MocA family oxidoreductase n=1 Tax=Streptomyces niphimycinicus TaxID=2842201 RepID=A0ABS6CCB3_9ACTN|nr:Gfo/Idh/MocA family oxidoreductase [Streptomyces niphimycinicus]MBU3864526.1 Gfo/Idh/MocA family oxidoreductase [Streptomyces niphimycinicus]